MKRISLISNSNIQYYKFDTEVSPDFTKINKVYFHQPFDANILDFTFDSLFKVIIDGNDTFYRKQELIDKEFIINNKLKDDVDLRNCIAITDFYETNNLKKVLKQFKKKWIPLPYFKDNSINKDVMYPTDWVRLYFDCN